MSATPRSPSCVARDRRRPQSIGFFLVLARVSAAVRARAAVLVEDDPRARARDRIARGARDRPQPVATHGQHLPRDAARASSASIAGGAARRRSRFAFALGALFAAVEAAGAFLDTVSGFSFGSLDRPAQRQRRAACSPASTALVGTMIFVAIGGDAWMLRGLARTFTSCRSPRRRSLGPARRRAPSGVRHALHAGARGRRAGAARARRSPTSRSASSRASCRS